MDFLVSPKLTGRHPAILVRAAAALGGLPRAGQVAQCSAKPILWCALLPPPCAVRSMTGSIIIRVWAIPRGQ